MSRKTKGKEKVIEVSEDEYKTDRARGLTEDEILPPGRHRFKRGGFLARYQAASPTPSDAKTPAGKIRISINLDQDVVDHFKKRAARPHSAPYQTQINETLREVMEKDKRAESGAAERQAEALLANRRFIEMVAEKVNAHQKSARKRNSRAA